MVETDNRNTEKTTSVSTEKRTWFIQILYRPPLCLLLRQSEWGRQFVQDITHKHIIQKEYVTCFGS
jgi:hypothetical protein